MAQEIDALVDGGAASAGPPLGPALGPAGVNVMDVVQAINEKTKDFEGMKVPVTVIVADDKSFSIKVGTPPTSALLSQQIDLDKGSGQPNVDKVGDVTVEQAVKVARQKNEDLLGGDLKAKTKEVLGTARSMGLTSHGKDPRQVQAEIDQGRYDSAFSED